MKIQFLNGGLANQAFQYIFARSYELSYPEDKMYLDDSYFALNTVHNGYELEKVFGIKAHMLSECFTEDVWNFILNEKRKGKSVPQILNDNGIEICMVSEVPYYQIFNPFDGKVYMIDEYIPKTFENIYYHGYWLNQYWFNKYRNVFFQEFRFPEIEDIKNKNYLHQIESTDSISIHIRRGDYVTLGWAYEAEIYHLCCKKFLEQVSGEWHLFVFSDDIPWCKENAQQLGILEFQKYTYVEGNIDGENYRDLQLMSMCKAMIRSNSAFCYLAALLNTKNPYIVCCTNENTVNIYPPDP